MGIGEILLMTVVVVMFLVACFRSAYRNKGGASPPSHIPTPGERQLQDDIARMRQIADYERFGSKNSFDKK
jgi:hypothetical protein